MNAPSKIEVDPELALMSALAKALPSLGTVHKGKANPHFKSNYADLAGVIKALAPLSEYGVWFRQVPVPCDNGIAYETFYIHEAGAQISAGITSIPVDKNNAQGFGSAQTYCRRYALMAAFGLAADDDDGNAAAQAAPKEKPATVSDEDLALIIQLCEAVGGNQAALITKAMGLESLKELSVNRVPGVIDRLKEKLAEKAKAETDQEAEHA